MTLTDTPFHVMGLERLVEEQPQDYIGKAALERIRREGVDRKLVGIEFDRERAVPGHHRRAGPPATRASPVGRVTDAVWSPGLSQEHRLRVGADRAGRAGHADRRRLRARPDHRPHRRDPVRRPAQGAAGGVAAAPRPAERRMRDPRYDVLFEPVPLGPVTARNRFFQVPHCNGMGHAHPSAHAEMRGVKAEGGWAVVCTEEVELHHSTDVARYIEGRLWDDADIPVHARLVEKVHEHGSLAGIELVHSGMTAANLYVRQPPMGPSPPAGADDRSGAGAADEQRDIADLRRWHRAGGRPLAAGRLRPRVRVRRPRPDDDPALPLAPLQRPQRRVRRQRREPRAAAARDPRGHARGGRRPGGGGLPDLRRRADRRPRHRARRDRGSARPGRRAARPVGLHGRRVGLRLDHLAVRRGGRAGAVRARAQGAHLQAGGRRRPVHLARHDGADGARRRARHDRRRPGRRSPTRSCPGRSRRGAGTTSASASAATSASPATSPRRRSAAPRTRAWARSGGAAGTPSGSGRRRSDASVLVVGAGPAGLEAAHALGKRGYDVVLAEAGDELGGRVAREARLPGLAAWIRVRRLPPRPARAAPQRRGRRSAAG